MPEIPVNNAKSFALKFALGGVLLMALGGIYFYGTPKQYEATAKVRVWKRGVSRTNEAVQPFRPEMLEDECRVLSSTGIVDNVIASLDLQKALAPTNPPGTTLSMTNARAVLFSLMRIQPVQNTSIIEIRVSGAEPELPARIANAVATNYQELRADRRAELSRSLQEDARQKVTSLENAIREARSRVDTLYFQAMSNRSTNTIAHFTPDAYAALQSQRIDLESQFVRDSKTLEELKALDPDQLRDVLSTRDTNRNSVLNKTILELFRARRELAAATIDHGPDSPEVKHAQVAAAELDKLSRQHISAIMALKSQDLAALKSSLDQLNELAHRATTNSVRTTPNAQITAYEKARRELADLEAQQDRLTVQRPGTLVEAAVPTEITVEILDPADPPSKPATPDPKIALAAVGAGAVSLVVSAVIVLMANFGKRKKTGVSKP